MIRNPLSYPGNKNRLISQIIPETPESKCFVDIFSGSGVVAVNSKSNDLVLNDSAVWATRILEALYYKDFEYISNGIEERIEKYGLTYSRIYPKGTYVEYKHEGLSLYNKKGYQDLKEHFNATHDILDLITLEIYGFNHYIRFNKNNEFNVPVGKVDFSESIYNDLESFIFQMKKKKIIFFNEDFRKEELYSFEDAFYYFDPPYLITTAPYNQNWNENDEADLLLLLDELNEKGEKFALSNVFLSNGKTNKMLVDWAEKYNTIFLSRQYRNANYQKKNITDTVEVLIKNY